MTVRLGYDLIRSRRRRRTISLQIKEDGRVVIRAPFHTPKWEIERFIEGKQSWIAEKLSEEEKQAKEAEKTFLPGEKFLYLGEWYPLEICESHHKKSRLRLSFGHFILRKDCMEKARDLFVEWYKKEAKEKIAERINYYSDRIHLFPKGIKITSGRSRWGSCSHDNRLSFSWRIIMASLAVIDYILLHELVHIREKNHSAKFWATLESILPDYRRHRLWLRENGHLLEL
jgi:hypothetical protein